MSCGQDWMIANSFSVYEQQAVESCPCPHCGAYTLCCREPAELPAAQKAQRLRQRQAVSVRP